MEIITQEERQYLLDEMERCLDYYNYEYTNSALEKIIDTWAKNKADLIQAFKKHPNYIEGKFMIAFDMDYNREINKEESYKFSNWLYTPMQAMKDSLPSEIKEKIAKEVENNQNFWIYSKHNELLPLRLYNFLSYLGNHAERTISEETASMLDADAPNAHIHAGMKTSRAVNKLCTYLGYDKYTEKAWVDGEEKTVYPYNKHFAAYADSLSPLKIKRHTILSIHPIDYLTMSIGNSWSSCHSIDNDGRERGCYSSGTISYMLDGVSMVFYTIGAEYQGNEYYMEPKVVRQMFFYGEEKLIQSRLYPQANDSGAKEYYDAYRAIVQKIMSEIFEFPNLWKVSRGTDATTRYIDGCGTHYEDYRHFSNCTLSRITGSENEEDITVGHDPICIECGYTHSVEGSINCCRTEDDGYYCTNCGDWVREDDVCWVGDEPYCSDCVTYCESCEEYTCDATYIRREHIYVCDDCLDRYYTYCECCGEYVDNDNAIWVESNDKWVCPECYDRYYRVCDKCGEIFYADDMHEHEGDYYCDNCYDEICEENQDEAC